MRTGNIYLQKHPPVVEKPVDLASSSLQLASEVGTAVRAIPWPFSDLEGLDDVDGVHATVLSFGVILSIRNQIAAQSAKESRTAARRPAPRDLMYMTWCDTQDFRRCS